MADSASITPAADLSLCDREPITRLGRIQSFGFLIAMTRDWLVTQVSSNLDAMLGVAPSAALGKSLDTLVDVDALHEIRNRLAGLFPGAVERLYGVLLLKGRPAFDLAVHYLDDCCILEGEPAGSDSRNDAASVVRKMVDRLHAQVSFDAFHHDAARHVRSLTGFDRVMIYRFSSDGAGEVIAEVVRQGKESFLGLHYPASDIPQQARALYLRNPFRIIADVSSTPAVLIAQPSDPAGPLDLSSAVTRAVSDVHIEYLRNMGVGASVSISIIVDGRLWGLIACHNDTPRLPTFAIRTAAELFGQMYSMILESRLRQSADHQDRQGRESVTRIVKTVAANPALLTDAGWLQDVLREVIQCDGIAVVCGEVTSMSGATPPLSAIAACVELLNALSPREVFVSDTLNAFRADIFAHTEIAAGVLSIPIARHAGDYILLFRREQLFDIKWAGAPGKAVSRDGDTGRLSPRKSFAVFAQTVRGRSRPFTDAEQRIAEVIRSGLIEVILRGAQGTEGEQQRNVGRQEILIAELNHRVRNVLALIRGLISQSQTDSGASANYVRSLSGRVQALARAHDRVTRQDWGPGPLNALFDDEIAAYVPAQRERFTITGPLVFLEPQAYSTLALIIHELVTNSSKYGSLSDTGSVAVSLCIKPGEGLHFRWLESGGPVVQVPTRRGFGSVIIERVVPFDLQGTARVSYLPAGLDAEFFIPQQYVAAARGTAPSSFSPLSNALAPALAAPARGQPLAGMTVLLLEDNLIVALEAEDLLKTLGAAAIVTVSSVTAATEICKARQIDFAVLDIHLGFENSLDFAVALRIAQVPFIFASGYGPESNPVDRHPEITVSKPYDRDYLTLAVANTLAHSASRVT